MIIGSNVKIGYWILELKLDIGIVCQNWNGTLELEIGIGNWKLELEIEN